MHQAVRVLAAGGSFLLGSLAMAQATPLSPSELLGQFNLIVTGDVTGTSGGHIHGRALVGGDLSGVSEVFSHGDGTPSSFAALTVAGDVAGNVTINNSGNAAVGSVSGHLQMNGGTVSPYGPDSAPENYGQILSDYATGLAGMAATLAGVTPSVTQNGQVSGYKVAGVANAVISLTEAEIYKENFTFNLDSAVDWVLVNVFATDSDKVFNLGSAFKLQQGGSVAKKLIWNFVGFDEVAFNSRFSVAALLADGATVKTTGGDIEGSVFAENFYGGSQLHYIGIGDTPDVAPPSPTPVPLPAGAPLLLLGLGALALLRTRKAA